MIHLLDIRYVRLGTRDRGQADRFAKDVLGLERVREEAGATYFRSDSRDHTLVYFDGDPTDHTVGFELRTADELEQAAAELSNRHIDVRAGTPDECEQRHVRAFVHFKDPTGNKIDLMAGAHHSGRRYFPARDAGITGFSHVGLCTTDAARDERFWTEVLGARVSDWIGAAPLLRIDEVHHKIALFPTTRSGVQHVNHQVESVDDIMRAWYTLQKLNVPIVFGPGRHPTSGARFLYFRGPDGMIFEYSTGVGLIAAQDEATYQPRQFPSANESFCMWGSVPDIPEFRTPGAREQKP
ncbi:VOC family protein [Xylophilus sp. ASV27]|uniref:VOC family protein n=1 Tax=Xylophilus sp. ASV27 TaxID=2795129 RepID=UPI0018ECF4AD|nr:VOC family protein [Xylophilus sp. ASV27]